MYVKRAIEVYQTTASTTTPTIDSIIQLLSEMSNLLVETQATTERVANPDVSEPLKKLQYVLFELMGVVDHRSEEGKRLVLQYVVINQSLLTVQLHKRYELLPEIREQVEQLLEAWSSARQNQRRQRFTTDVL
ncbi:flagellar protein FliS [Sporosarcina obsidiansis]|uniref:flagellar protein FliS n=1 Tax=Sporosarcina obsidiansis TaxID=2660748 RepID=UPI00129A6AD3|nr:flagellar protein FliS [Sporosarcina obsidiansis]